MSLPTFRAALQGLPVAPRQSPFSSSVGRVSGCTVFGPFPRFVAADQSRGRGIRQERDGHGVPLRRRAAPLRGEGAPFIKFCNQTKLVLAGGTTGAVARATMSSAETIMPRLPAAHPAKTTHSSAKAGIARASRSKTLADAIAATTPHIFTQDEGNSGSSSSNGYESSFASASPFPRTPARMPTWGLSPPSKRSSRTS